MRDNLAITEDIAAEPNKTAQPPELQRAHDRIIRGMASGRRQTVFDEFWREGELALMFGASGTGKTLLAMRVASALASGGDIPWFQMDPEPANVLYVDLSMSDRQFAARHSYTGRGGKDVLLPMSRRLFCDRPENESDLVEWLEARIESERIKYVIIDDLSAVMNTCDGTRETLGTMRGLRRLRERFDISILVVMQSDEPSPGAVLSEKDLGRQRVLCRQADSVFGIGRQPDNRDKIYMMQTRSASSALVWTKKNGVFGTIKERRGIVGIEFDLRMSEEDAKLITAIHKLHEAGESYRKIATELRISKSRAARLNGRWLDLVHFEMQKALEDNYDNDVYEGEDEDHDEGPCDDDHLFDNGLSDERAVVERVASIPVMSGEMHGPHSCPFLYDGSDDAKRWQKFLFAKFPDRDDLEIVNGYAAGDEWCRPPGAVPSRDPEDPFAGMEVDVDALGNVKYVEERAFDGKPSIYYAYRPDGRLRRFEWEKMTLANPNLFGKFANIGKNGNSTARRGNSVESG